MGSGRVGSVVLGGFGKGLWREKKEKGEREKKGLREVGGETKASLAMQRETGGRAACGTFLIRSLETSPLSIAQSLYSVVETKQLLHLQPRKRNSLWPRRCRSRRGKRARAGAKTRPPLQLTATSLWPRAEGGSEDSNGLSCASAGVDLTSKSDSNGNQSKARSGEPGMSSVFFSFFFLDVLLLLCFSFVNPRPLLFPFLSFFRLSYLSLALLDFAKLSFF